MVQGTRRKKLRLDQLLAERGFFDDPKDALAAIMRAKVVVDGAVVTKPGTAVARGAEIALRGPGLQYASRGGYKLAHAIACFGHSFRGQAVLDAGASTGGFTDCLLQAGARRVTAVDVGFGQLRGRLAADPRVVVMEKTNISHLTPETAAGTESCTVDLSYLSLRKAIPILRDICGRGTPMICLVKPLYEGLAESLKGDVGAAMPILEGLLEDLANAGHPVAAAVPSPIFGGRGAIEFLIHLPEGSQPPSAMPSPRTLADHALAAWEAAPAVTEIEDLGGPRAG